MCVGGGEAIRNMGKKLTYIGALPYLSHVHVPVKPNR